MKHIHKWLLILLISCTFLYLLSNAVGLTFASNFLSPSTALLSAALMGLNLKKVSPYKTEWFVLMLASLIWGFSDFSWLIMDTYVGTDPQDSLILSYVYTLPNICLLFAILSYFMKHFKNWHRSQLIADASISFFILLIMLRFSLIERVNWEFFSFWDNLPNLLNLITSLGIISFVIILFLAFRTTNKNPALKWVLAGYVLYCCTDLFFVYSDFMDTYTPNALIDSSYILSLSFFGVGSAKKWKTTTENELGHERPTFASNLGWVQKNVLVLILPLIMFFTGRIAFQAIIGLIIFVTLYHFASSYIKISIDNENLLVEQRDINNRLEALVAERTKALNDSYKRLERQAIVDPLSSLYNRRYFLDKLDELIATQENAFSLYFMDLDDFKAINDTHGHNMGDKVLKEVSNRLYKWQKDSTIAMRIGGDEFAVIHIHDDFTSPPANHILSESIFELFLPNIIVDDYSFKIGVSIGVSRFPTDASDRESLVKYADLAMYQAKCNLDFNKCVFYSHQYGHLKERRNRIDLLLKTVNLDDEFSLHYQPQFTTDGNQIIGIEALMRWDNPELGPIDPTEFMKIAEDNGSVNRLGKWCIDAALSQVSIWNKGLLNPLRIAINLSPLQFDSIDFFPFIQSTLEKYQVSPEWVDFEVTESSAMNSSTAMEEIFSALSGLGVSISVDDFGTGYSSLSFINRFDIDHLKIAKELIDTISDQSGDRSIIKAIILMAKGMGLKTLAEGVETKTQLDILTELQCDAIQGFYFSRPLSKEEFEAQYVSQ